MEHRIHSSHIGQQCLCSTDIGSCFFALDVLLAGLQRHAQCAVAVRIYAYTNDTAGNAAFKIILSSKECSMRAAISQWHAKTLRRTKGHIGTQLARRGKQRKRQQVGSHSHISAGSMYFINKAAVIFYTTLIIRVLHEGTEISIV